MIKSTSKIVIDMNSALRFYFHFNYVFSDLSSNEAEDFIWITI